MNQKQLTAYLPWLFFLLLIAVVGFILYQPHQTNPSYSSTFSLTPSPSVPPSAPTEPVVTAWQQYTNDQYNFSLQIPSGWQHQEYTASFPRPGEIIAFSPDSLPCSSCSYFRNGYLSVRIYDEKTAPSDYSMFQQEMQALGKSPKVQPISLAGKTGVLYAGTYAVENNNTVYEFSLDENNGNAQVANAKVFREILNSLSFTNLQFSQ